MKLYNSLEVARQSVKNDKMMSAYMSEFVSFNVLDKDYVEAKQKKMIEVWIIFWNEGICGCQSRRR